MCTSSRDCLVVGIVLVALIVPGAGHAVTTQFWKTETQEQMAEGELDGMSITSAGRLVLAPDREMIFDTGESYVWALARGENGDLFVATGDNGIIHRIPLRGDPEVLYDSEELEILSLVVDKDGWVYAGTSPEGLVLKISPEGEGSAFFDSPEEYVWDLVLDGRGNLYAATGDEGRIYKIDRDGQASVFYDASETHIMCLLYDPATGLYAGGEGRGLLYRVDPSGNASVLYDAEEPEISALAMDNDGNLFAAGVEGIEDDNGDGENGNAGRACIYQVTPTGAVSRHFRVPASFVFNLEVTEDGRVLIATGGEGRLYAVDAHEEWWEIVDLDEVQILEIYEDRRGLYLGTGNSGRVYRLGTAYAKEGRFTSKPFRARTLAEWGTLRWEGELPDGCTVEFSLRVGNTEEPDDTWSEWTRESNAPHVFEVAGSRYAQWRVRCESGGERTPEIESVTVAYLEHNLPPKLTLLTVLPSGETFYEGIPDGSPPPVSQVLPGGVRVQYSVSGLGIETVPEEKLGWVRSIRTARWEASDPNRDALVFDVAYRGIGEERWKILEEDWVDPVYSWESERMPDGRYQLKVVAEDAPDNPEEHILKDELVSDPFEIDNTAPELLDLKARRVGDGVEVSGRARDRMSPLKKGRYSVNAGEWQPFLPEDGLFDSVEEKVRFTLPSVGAGEHTILMRVVDAAGNPCVATVVVR